MYFHGTVTMEICKLDFLCEWHDSCTKGSINSTSYWPCQSCCYQFINSSETLHPLTDPINQHYQSKQTHSVVNQLVNTQLRCSKTNLKHLQWMISLLPYIHGSCYCLPCWDIFCCLFFSIPIEGCVILFNIFLFV